MSQSPPFIIGITGPSGSGKSLFRRFLEERGFLCIDADEVYHGMLVPPSPCLEDLRAAFGDSVFHEDGALDRKALGNIVFHDDNQLELLNKTVLFRVLERIRQQIAAYGKEGAPVVFVDAPTLIESGFHRECQKVITVLAPAAFRTERIALRDHLTAEQANTRIQAQKQDEFYVSHSDYVLHNDCDTASFLSQAEVLLQQLEPFFSNASSHT